MGPIDESSKFVGGEIEVVPSERGKSVVNLEE